jgi:hypothetical protein
MFDPTDFGIDKIGLRVALKEDLTLYHESLVKGTEGITIGYMGELSKYQPDRFIMVCFPEITLDVLWKRLRIV